jgi:hypothetical protein
VFPVRYELNLYINIYIYKPPYIYTDWYTCNRMHNPIIKNLYIEVVGLERGSLSLVSTTEELLDRKVAAPV